MNRLALALVLYAVAAFAGEYTTEKEPVPIHRPEACYTEEARRAGVQGDVMLSAEIHPDGLLHSIRVTRSLEPGLDANAMESLKMWRFKPAENHGEPVIAPVIIQVNFRLSGANFRCVSAPRSGTDQNGRK